MPIQPLTVPSRSRSARTPEEAAQIAEALVVRLVALANERIAQANRAEASLQEALGALAERVAALEAAP